MFTVRDVITEALARATLVNRRQPPPGNMTESAYRLLKGIAADYSSHNLLQFLRREIDLNEAVIKDDQYDFTDNYITNVNFWFSVTDLPIPSPMYWSGPKQALAWDGQEITAHLEPVGAGEVSWVYTRWPSRDQALASLMGVVFKAVIPGGLQATMKIGTIDNTEPNDWVQVPVENLEAIKEIYWDRTEDPMANAAIPLSFVSFEDFNNGSFGDYVYTWQHITDTKTELKFKPRFMQIIASCKKVKMIYNVKYNFDLDSVLKIPDIYQELFVAALTYKLACEFPRLSPEHTERLKANMEAIENSVRTPTRASKLVIREPGVGNSLYSMGQLNSGSFIFPR